MRLKKFISIIMVVLLVLPTIPTYVAAQDDVLGVMFSWSDNDSEYFSPFEEGKPLSYYTNQMQSVPVPDGMRFVGWKLHGATELLNDNSAITADMRDAETPDIVWIEAVFEEEQTVLGVMFSWSDNDSEFISPFEDGKQLSYYTNQMQSVPAQDGMNFVGWKLHGATELLNDNSVITADMRDAETPEIVWIEAVFEEIVEEEPEEEHQMFIPRLLPVTVKVEEGAKVNTSAKFVIAYGARRTIKITVEEGFEVADIIVNGKSVGAADTYTLKGVTKAQNIVIKTVEVAEEVAE